MTPGRHLCLLLGSQSLRTRPSGAGQGFVESSGKLRQLPLTADEDTPYVVVEMGLYHACRINRESVVRVIGLAMKEYYVGGNGLSSENTITQRQIIIIKPAVLSGTEKELGFGGYTQTIRA